MKNASNSEANALELLDYFLEMHPRYYMHSDKFNTSTFQPHNSVFLLVKRSTDHGGSLHYTWISTCTVYI